MRALGRIALVVALCCAAGRVRAQDAEDAEQPANAMERARQHMERGQALYLQARFEEAAAEFEAAYQAQPFSAFLYNAGVALERAGQPARAAEFFEQYVQRDPSASDAQAVRERITALRRALADEQAGQTSPPDPSTESPPAPATPDAVPEDFKSLLSVRTNPEGATIVVRRIEEGREQGEVVARGPAPFAHTLDAGRFNVTVEHPDYQTVNQDVRIEPGKVYVVIVEMSQGQFLGYLRVVSSVPGARVYVDDREQGPRGQTPWEAPTPVGTHRVWVERPGYELEEREIEVGIGDDVTVEVDLQRVAFGRVRVVSNVDSARVLVDGQVIGTVPYEGQVPAGSHTLRVEANGMKAYESRLEVQRGQLTPVRVRLRPDVGRSGAIVTSVFTALFVAGGVTLAVLGNDLAQQVRDARDAGALANDDPRLDHGLLMWIGADASFAVALILGGIALYSFLNDPLPPSEGTLLEPRDWTLAPMFDPERGAGGLAIAGRF